MGTRSKGPRMEDGLHVGTYAYHHNKSIPRGRWSKLARRANRMKRDCYSNTLRKAFAALRSK